MSSNTVSATVGQAMDAWLTSRIARHQYQHTMACQMVATGATLPAVRDALRHSSLGPTNVYLQTRPEALRDEMEGRTYFDDRIAN